jgi:hypothetical protein
MADQEVKEVVPTTNDEFYEAATSFEDGNGEEKGEEVAIQETTAAPPPKRESLNRVMLTHIRPAPPSGFWKSGDVKSVAVVKEEAPLDISDRLFRHKLCSRTLTGGFYLLLCSAIPVVTIVCVIVFYRKGQENYVELEGRFSNFTRGGRLSNFTGGG